MYGVRAFSRCGCDSFGACTTGEMNTISTRREAQITKTLLSSSLEDLIWLCFFWCLVKMQQTNKCVNNVPAAV